MQKQKIRIGKLTYAFILGDFGIDYIFSVQLSSEQISYIGYPTITNAKFTPAINRLSIVTAARISNIAGLVYSIYLQNGTLIQSPSAGLRTPLPPRFKTCV
jgi:hypothetical protein